jgi:hypothetical protein
MTWVVVDDCIPRTPVMDPGNCDVRVVNAPWVWKPGTNTQAQSIRFGLQQIEDDAARVLVLEDDDVYLPGHVLSIVKHLDSFDLVGERLAKYYNVRTRRYRELPGMRHCSLASTGLKGPAIGKLLDIVETPGAVLIDAKLWVSFTGRKRQLRTANVVGIKGMPGRGGIGVGHRPTFGKTDVHGKFEAAVGAAIARQYEEYAR